MYLNRLVCCFGASNPAASQVEMSVAGPVMNALQRPSHQIMENSAVLGIAEHITIPKALGSSSRHVENSGSSILQSTWHPTTPTVEHSKALGKARSSSAALVEDGQFSTGKQSAHSVQEHRVTSGQLSNSDFAKDQIALAENKFSTFFNRKGNPTAHRVPSSDFKQQTIYLNQLQNEGLQSFIRAIYQRKVRLTSSTIQGLQITLNSSTNSLI